MMQSDHGRDGSPNALQRARCIRLGIVPPQDHTLEPLFHLTWICLAADILCAAFSPPWYFRTGLPILRLRRRSTGRVAGPFPGVQALDDHMGKSLLGRVAFRDLGRDVYAFRRAPREGPSLLQGLITFNVSAATFEVHGRISLFFAGFLISLTALAIHTGSSESAMPVVVFLAAGVLFLFLLRDFLVCRKVAATVSFLW